MFDNIGGKLKGLSKFVAIGGIVLCVINGLIIMFTTYNGFVSGLGILIGGSLACYLGSWMTYAFGDLVENVEIIANSVSKIAKPQAPSHSLSDIASNVVNSVAQRFSKPTASNANASLTPDTWTCPKCSTLNSKTSFICKDCGHSR